MMRSGCLYCPRINARPGDADVMLFHPRQRSLVMIRRNIALTLLITAWLIADSGCDGGISTRGRVLDETGNPIKGATVILVSRGKEDRRISSDDGSYDVGVIHASLTPVGKLTASKEGYETYEKSFNSREELAHNIVITLRVGNSSKATSP